MDCIALQVYIYDMYSANAPMTKNYTKTWKNARGLVQITFKDLREITMTCKKSLKKKIPMDFGDLEYMLLIQWDRI